MSLHALKHRLMGLLTSREPAAAVLAELPQSFQATQVSVRRRRSVARRKFSPSRSSHYQRCERKIVL